MSNWGDPSNILATAAIAVQTFLLAGVLWYTLETKRLRVQAENQTEGLYKPCLTLWPALRETADAILGFEGAEGIFVLGSNEGAVVIQNVGSGSALNVRYDFAAIGPALSRNTPHPEGYFPMIVSGQKVRLPLSLSTLSVLDWQVTLSYTSMGGRHYQSLLVVRNHVIIDFKLAEYTA